jgi:hypothetical protein
MSITTRGMGGTLQLAGQPDLPVTVLLRHDPADASCLRVVLVLDAEEFTDLPLDRALVTAGLIDPVADGDVSVRAEGDRAVVAVAGLTLSLGLADLIDVLLASYQAAPTGTERDAVISLTAARELLQA